MRMQIDGFLHWMMSLSLVADPPRDGVRDLIPSFATSKAKQNAVLE